MRRPTFDSERHLAERPAKETHGVLAFEWGTELTKTEGTSAKYMKSRQDNEGESMENHILVP